MPSIFLQAGKLLNESEFALFAASRAHVLRTLTSARLLAKIQRTRALRDKYRELPKRQQLVTRARTGSKAATRGADRTNQKAQLLTQVLQRFENRLAQIKAAEARAGGKKATVQAREAVSRKQHPHAAKSAAQRAKASAKTPARRGGRATQGLQATSESARSARHAMQFKIAGQQAIHAHVSARGRRNQAKRDSRG
jgi:hypothetical protein